MVVFAIVFVESLFTSILVSVALSARRAKTKIFLLNDWALNIQEAMIRSILSGR
jgi:hypothetical protein